MTSALQMDMVPKMNFGLVAASAPAADNGCWKTGLKQMNIFKSVKDEVLVPIHPAGWPFIFLFILASAIITYFWAGIPCFRAVCCRYGVFIFSAIQSAQRR
jgi:hypothetical protein